MAVTEGDALSLPHATHPWLSLGRSAHIRRRFCTHARTRRKCLKMHRRGHASAHATKSRVWAQKHVETCARVSSCLQACTCQRAKGTQPPVQDTVACSRVPVTVLMAGQSRQARCLHSVTFLEEKVWPRAVPSPSLVPWRTPWRSPAAPASTQLGAGPRTSSPCTPRPLAAGSWCPGR